MQSRNQSRGLMATWRREVGAPAKGSMQDNRIVSSCARLSLPSYRRRPVSTTLLAARRQVVEAGMRRHDAVSASRALLEAVISRRTLSRVGSDR